uniref:AMP-binding domain-containing protein n=1 Tax=Bursaphelenchus xylophilus TaxID=6326 RepID=A0A1I7SA24_BURXY
MMGRFGGYGMTEIVALSHLSPLDLPLTDVKHLTSCGKLLPRFESKVIDIETAEEITEPNRKGELLLRSDCVMKGYLNDPKATEETIDCEKWLHTGDIVYFDAEGFYFIVDRIKNLIKVNGMQLSPLELEHLLLANDIVAEAAVIGVPAESFGEVPRAFVVLNSVPEDAQKVTEQLRESVNAQVAAYKQLRGGLVILPSLPRTASGKVQKEELRRFSLTPVILPQITETLVDLKINETEARKEENTVTQNPKIAVKLEDICSDEDETFL